MAELTDDCGGKWSEGSFLPGMLLNILVTCFFSSSSSRERERERETPILIAVLLIGP